MVNYEDAAILISACNGVRPILWQDEVGTPFILTKHMEVYAYSSSVLGCYCWHRKTYLRLKNMELIFDEMGTSDPIYWFNTDRLSLPLILELGAFKRRPRIKGNWVKKKEKLLGHRIIPVSQNHVQKIMNTLHE